MKKKKKTRAGGPVVTKNCKLQVVYVANFLNSPASSKSTYFTVLAYFGSGRYMVNCG